MRWLRGTCSHKLRFKGGYPLDVQIFTDASHATNPDTRRSITGVIIKVGGNTVKWLGLYQRIVSHSSSESELMALDKGATVGQHIAWLMELLGADVARPISVYVDNQSAILISQNPVQPGRNVHIHARYYYVRDLVQIGEYIICHLRSEDQIADLMCSYKTDANFWRLYGLTTGCARVELDNNVFAWNTSMLYWVGAGQVEWINLLI